MFFVPSSGIDSIAMAKNVPIPAFTQHTQKLINYHAINSLMSGRIMWRIKA